jgi:hypothetical protein
MKERHRRLSLNVGNGPRRVRETTSCPDERIAAKIDQFGIAVTTSNFHALTTSFKPSALNLSWPLLLQAKMDAKQLPAVAAMVRKQLHPRRDRGASNSRAPPVSRVPIRPSEQNRSWGLTRYV